MRYLIQVTYKQNYDFLMKCSYFCYRSKSKSPDIPLTPEERDARTVFIMQLSQRVRARDVEEFFSAVGKIKDVKLIICNKTRRFKGICYVEFKDLESVPLVRVIDCWVESFPTKQQMKLCCRVFANFLRLFC